MVRHRRLLYASAAVLAALLLAVATRYVYRLITDPAVLAVWWIGVAALSFRIHALVKARRVHLQPFVTGRIVAIVAAHEQHTKDLHACVWSILDQRGVLVDEVHVVDDGSTDRPVQPFAHPRVRWHRTRNRGRQAAVGYVLDRLEPDSWDFVLIAGGDCVLDDRSMQRQLRAFSRPRVMATTGTVGLRDHQRNLLTRIADLALSASPARPGGPLGIVAGAPVLYRAGIPFRCRHLDAEYAAREGEIVEVAGAVASIPAPSGLRAVGRQWLDWSASWWHAVPPALGGSDGHRGVIRRLLALTYLVIAPLTVGYAVVSLATSRWRDPGQWPAIALFAGLYLLMRYAATGLYPAGRRRKLRTWLLLTPVEALCNLVFLLPLKYAALARLCWHGRGAAPSAAPAPGAVYYSGYLPGGHGS